MKQYSRVYAEIDLDAIAYNMEQMKKRIGGDSRLIAVIKTDGYGHGAVPIAKMFESIPYVWGLGLCDCLYRRGSCSEKSRNQKADSCTRLCFPG